MRAAIEPEQEERLLIEQARDDPDAFQALYHAYFPRVYAYIAYRVGREWDAEDVTAEVFMRVVEAFDRFEYRGVGSFAAWVFSIAHNQMTSFYRRRPQYEALPLDELPDMHSDSPDESFHRKETFQRLREVITTLAPRRQEIVTLRFFGGLRNREIAQILGLDERTVAAHLCRALEDLQKKYADEIRDGLDLDL